MSLLHVTAACMPRQLSACSHHVLLLLTGLGGSVAQALVSRGISHIAQLQQHSAAQLALLLDVGSGEPAPSGAQQQQQGQAAQQQKLVARLAAWGWGCDDAPVVDRGPPKTIQVR